MRISDWSSDVCSSDLDIRWIGGLPGSMVSLYSGSTISSNRAPTRLIEPTTRLPSIFTRALRSEEHTSELQSLMRISYAVFCLKKKITTYHHTRYRYTILTKEQQNI